MKSKLLFILVFIFAAFTVQAQYPACTQIEDLTIPAGSKWIKKTTVAGYSGTGYVEWNGGNKFSGEPAVADVLVFKFTVPADGVYTVMFRGRRQKGEGGCPIDAAGDGCNDIRTKVNTGLWHKTMIKSTFGEWIWDASVEIEGMGIRAREHNFKAGEEQTVYITGRSVGVQLDGVVIVPIAGFLHPRNYPADYSLKLDCDQIFPPKPTDCWSKSYNEGWNFARPDGYLASVNSDIQRGAIGINTVVQPKDKWAASVQTYDGDAAVTNIYLTTLLEKEGECSYIVFVDGMKVLEFTNPRSFGTALGEGSPYVIEVKDVPVQKGSVIQVDCISHTNKLIPDTAGGFNYARGRWRSLTLGACAGTTVNKSMGTLGFNVVQMEGKIDIYPNPVTDILNIEFSEAELSKEIKIFNSLGQMIYRTQTTNASATIDVKALKISGVVMIQVVSGSSTYNNKVIIK